MEESSNKSNFKYKFTKIKLFLNSLQLNKDNLFKIISLFEIEIIKEISDNKGIKNKKKDKNRFYEELNLALQTHPRFQIDYGKTQKSIISYLMDTIKNKEIGNSNFKEIFSENEKNIKKQFNVSHIPKVMYRDTKKFFNSKNNKINSNNVDQNVIEIFEMITKNYNFKNYGIDIYSLNLTNDYLKNFLELIILTNISAIKANYETFLKSNVFLLLILLNFDSLLDKIHIENSEIINEISISISKLDNLIKGEKNSDNEYEITNLMIFFTLLCHNFAEITFDFKIKQIKEYSICSFNQISYFIIIKFLIRL